MGGDCWPRSKQIPKITGCSPSQRLTPCSECGNKTTCHRMQEGPGLVMKTGWRRRCSTFLLTILTHRRQRTAQRIGLGTPVQFSETCDEDLPRPITQDTTNIAPTPDRHALADIHASLEQPAILP